MFLKLQNEINNKSDCVECTCFMTSIKNESLYRVTFVIINCFVIILIVNSVLLRRGRLLYPIL